jgi:hypothetical protein
MNIYARGLLFLALVLLSSGCRSVLPSEDRRPRTPWTNFNDADAAFDKIVPHKTTVADLKDLGFDPHATPNVRIITYLDIINRFLPNNSLKLDDLQPDVRACIESKDCCHAYEINLDITNNKRYGSVVLDIFGFNKKTHVTGWSYRALIIVKDEVVTYKLRAGEPNVNKYERKTKPLGPFQELDNLLWKIPGM